MVAPCARQLENQGFINVAVAGDQQHRQVGDVKQPHQREKRECA